MRISIFFIVSTFCTISLFAKENKISFIENKNQWGSQINAKANLPGGALFLTNTKIVYSFFKEKDLETVHKLKHSEENFINYPVHFHAYEIELLGANSSPSIQKINPLPSYSNYFIGNNSTKWANYVKQFEKIKYENTYPDIDVEYYSKNSSLEYDFIVKPHAHTNQIQLNYNGVTPILTSKGELLIRTTVNELIETAPFAYQFIDGKKMEVTCQFVLKNNTISFQFPNDYNHDIELIIDPVMVFKTYSGSTATTYGWSATYDLSGNLYSGGECFNTGWPVTVGAFQTTYGSGVDASINVYNPTGSSLIYSTYFGGANFDTPNSLVVNSANELVICGATSSANIATTVGCFDNSYNGSQDIYLTHFNSTGSALIGSTYIGGTNDDGENDHEVNFDNNGDIIVASSTFSQNFPTTAGAFQTTFSVEEGCFFKMNSNCTNLLFSTLIGGNDFDYCKSAKQNSIGQYVVSGYTTSNNFPTTSGTVHPTQIGSQDGFLLILNSSATTLIASTYIGTTGNDIAQRVQIDPLDNILVCGTSSFAYPISTGVYSNPGGNVFIDKLNPTLTASILSTRVGSTTPSLSYLRPAAFLLDNCNNIYVSCLSAGPNLPLSGNAYQTTQGGFWLCVLSPNFASLTYATYMGDPSDHIDGGSSRFDPQGIVYQSVCTPSLTAYTFPTSFSPTNQAGGYDVASFKFDFEAAGVNSNSALVANDSVCAPALVNFINNTSGGLTYVWDFGDGSPVSTAFQPSHLYTLPGTYTIKLVAFNPSLCVTEDSSFLTIHVFEITKPILFTKDTVFCDPNATFALNAYVTNLSPTMFVQWQPSNAIISGGNTLNPVINPAISMDYTCIVTDSIGTICKDTAMGIIHISFGDTSKFKVNPIDTIVCYGENVQLTAEGGNSYLWNPAKLVSDSNAAIVNLNIYDEIYFSVLIKDIYGCKATRFTHVKNFPETHLDAGPEDVVRYGEQIELNASGAFTYFWNYDPSLSSLQIPNPIATPHQETMYYVSGADQNGCKLNDSVLIHISNAVLPNAFSPNADGINDIFKFIPSSKYTFLKSLKIFNRWGQELFYSNQAPIGWNGTFNGKTCEIGTYYYLCEYSIGSKGYMDKGDFILIR